MSWTCQQLEEVIVSVLNPGEELLSVYQAESSGSLYACILLDARYYKVFRVSDHPTTSRYKQPTFYEHHGSFYIRGKIRTFLYDEGRWRKVTPSMLALLKFFNDMDKDIASIYGRRTRERGLELYLEIDTGHTIRRYSFPESIRKGIADLLATGLLITTGAGKGYFRILASQFVAPYVNKLAVEWPKGYKSSSAQLNWSNVDHQLVFESEIVKPPSTLVGWLVHLVLAIKVRLVDWLTSIRPSRKASSKPIEIEKEKEALTGPKLHNQEQEAIKQIWDKNIKRRSKNKIHTVLSSDQLEKLQALKKELSDE